MLPAILGLALGACASTSELEKPTSVREQDAYTVLDVTNLDLAMVKLERTEKDFVVHERGMWRRSRGSLPVARIHLARVKEYGPSNLVFVQRKTLHELIGIWYPRADVTFGKSGWATNSIGELEYQHFLTQPGPVACVAMRQYADTFADTRGYTRGTWKEPKGNIVITADYCESISVSDDRVMRFLGAIGCKYYAAPTPNQLAKPFQKRR